MSTTTLFYLELYHEFHHDHHHSKKDSIFMFEEACTINVHIPSLFLIHFNKSEVVT